MDFFFSIDTSNVAPHVGMQYLKRFGCLNELLHRPFYAREIRIENGCDFFISSVYFMQFQKNEFKKYIFITFLKVLGTKYRIIM